MSELVVKGLDYVDVRKNFVNFLKTQVDSENQLIYKDYDFTASGIGTLINVLSYNTHLLAYYIKMLSNESYIDTAIKKESLFSKAKLNGYIPNSKKCARIDVRLTVDVLLADEPESKAILIPRKSDFVSANDNSDQRIFYAYDDIFVKNIDYTTVPGYARYTSDVVTLLEGTIKEWKVEVDNTIYNQRFIIRDDSVDIDTIKVYVTSDGSVDIDQYLYVENSSSLTINSESKVFYISTQEEGFYEIFFGDNVYGKTPDHKSLVTIEYIASHGVSGNGCRLIRMNTPMDVPDEYSIPNWVDFRVYAIDDTVSYGGSDAETLEKMKFNIPYHFRTQNRIVTASDYRSLLLQKLGFIDSISVWGGENNYNKDYGKIFISVKPKFGDKLTESAKESIEKTLIDNYCIIGMQPFFVDPEFIDIDLDIYAKIDSKKMIKSLGTIEKEINQTVVDFNNNNLNVFDNYYSDVELLDAIRENNSEIKSCYTKKSLNKNIKIYYGNITENVLLFGNPLVNIKSSLFVYGNKDVYIKDENGLLYIFDNITNLKYIIKSVGTLDYNTGVCKFTFPEFAKTKENNFITYGVLQFNGISQNPDIETFLQNILRIAKIRIYLSTT